MDNAEEFSKNVFLSEQHHNGEGKKYELIITITNHLGKTFLIPIQTGQIAQA